jgi:sugar lactone lactonase YvrE
LPASFINFIFANNKDQQKQPRFMKRTFYKLAAVLALALGVQAASAQTISTAVGTGVSGNTGDGGPATAAQIGKPSFVRADGKGNYYVADSTFSVIRKITSAGVISTIAGTGTAGYSGDGGAATLAQLAFPTGIAIDTAGNVFISDYFNNCVRKVDALTGNISTYAGIGGSTGYSGDGGLANAAKMTRPGGLACDIAGNLYIADTYNDRVRKVTASTGIISTFVGCPGTTGCPGAGFGGDGGAANSTLVRLYNPKDVAVDAAGNIFFADQRNNRIRRVDAATNNLTTVAGGTAGGYGGDGGPAIGANMVFPAGVNVDASGNILIADQGNNVIRKVNSTTLNISTYAGTTNTLYNGDGIPATTANISSPTAVTMDIYGNVYVADYQNFRIRKIGNHGLETKQNEASTATIALVPNPNKGEFTIKGTLGSNAASDAEFAFEVADMLGHIVYKSKARAEYGHLYVPVSMGNNLANGMYLLMVRTENEQSVVRFVISN